MRRIDDLTVQQQHVSSSLQLMKSAARACYDAIAEHFLQNLADRKALILCGPGNNGGDGAGLAQELAHVGVQTTVVLFGQVDSTKGDARTNFDAVRGGTDFSLCFVECDSPERWENLPARNDSYDIVVDALFGTGLKRPLQGLFANIADHMLQLRANREAEISSLPLILSIDIPSGLNADMRAAIGPAVHADVTVTFTAPKSANVLPPASHLNGEVIVADIGSPPSLIAGVKSNLFVIEESDARRWLIRTRYEPDSFKNTHGHVLVIAGSRGYTGAAALCGNAAMKSGAGLVTVATPASAQPMVVAASMPEVMTVALAETDRGAVSEDAVNHVSTLTEKATVVAIGPGLSSNDERTRRFVESVVRNRQTPVVIDADGLNSLSPWPNDLRGTVETPLVLTPHPGEMLRLLGTSDKSRLDDRAALARDFATRNEVILVLKGSGPLVAAPDGRVFVNPTGNAGLGTAGAGDTLTGIIAGFIAQATATKKTEVLDAVLTAVYIGGLAGDLAASELGMRTMVASDIREHLSQAVMSIDPGGELP